MKCRRCQQLLSQRIDGDLAPPRERAVDHHVAACAVCAAVRDELASMTALLASLPGAEPGDGLWSRMDAALDADERGRRPSRRPMLVAAMGGAALLTTVGAAQGLQSGARRGAVALDAAMREGSGQTVRSLELRYAAAESEAWRLAGDPAALPAEARAWPEALPGGAPAVSAAGEIDDGLERIEARLEARAERILDVANAAVGPAGGATPGRELRDPWSGDESRGRTRPRPEGDGRRR